jgi:PIN domain nuclease of toxin-antitoxin system
VKLLIDTHIFLALTPHRRMDLDARMAALLGDPSHRVSVSVASLWEIAIKNRLGKLNLGISRADLPLYVQSLGIELLPISARHAVTDIDPLPPTRDPFDRLLLAQCLVEGCRLVTVYGALRDHPLAFRFSSS